MKISELIKELQKVQEEHGDVEVLAIENTWGEGEWLSLEDCGELPTSYDREWPDNLTNAIKRMPYYKEVK